MFIYYLRQIEKDRKIFEHLDGLGIPFNGNHFVYWKMFFLVEAITFKRSCCS